MGEAALPGDVDRELIAKSLQGNEKAFGDLIGRHHGAAYAVIRGILGDSDEVEDVLQQVYIKIHRGLPAFRGEARFSTWVYQIARNEALNAAKRRRFENTPIEEVALAAPEATSPERAYGRRELGERMEAAMARLDESHRLALELRYMGDRSYDEIAEMMQIPLGTVKTYIHRGKAQLKEILEREEGRAR